MSASAADYDRFRAEFQHRLPPDRRDLADASLQLRATVAGAPVTWWHQPAAEVVPWQCPCKSRSGKGSR